MILKKKHSPAGVFRASVATLLIAASYSAWAIDPFTVRDIRVEGLQRIPVATVYRLLPFEEGQILQADDVARATHDLYNTGNFQDVGIFRQGNQIVVRVAERPSISDIELTGNKAITKEDLLAGLSRAGLAKGSVFKRSTLERIQVELERQYVAQGRYGAQVTAEVVPQPRNRVAINISVREGDVAAVTAALTQAGETVHRIGHVAAGEKGCTVFGSVETWSAQAAWSATHHG